MSDTSISKAFTKGLIGLAVGKAQTECVKLGYCTRELRKTSEVTGKFQHDRITLFAPNGIVTEAHVG